MSINYQDLQRLVSDLRYILQTGGNPFNAGGSFTDSFNKLTDTMKTLIVFVALVVVFIIIWRFLFRGYPKLLFDIATLSFYRREDVDKFLDSKGFMFNHYKQLLRTQWGTYDPFQSLSQIFQYQNSSLQMAALRVQSLLGTHYAKLNYDDRLREMFREFYLYDKRINTNRKKVVYSWIEYSLRNPGKPIPMVNSPEAAAAGKYRETPQLVQTPTIIEYTDFYETLLEYKKKRGLLTEKDYQLPYENRRKKNDEELVIEMYVKDKMAAERGAATYDIKRVREMNEAIHALALECKLIVDRIREMPIAMYITLPDKVETVAAFKLDFDSRKDMIYNGSIYNDNIKYTSMNEFSWYMFEVLPFVRDGSNSFNAFDQQFENRLQGISDQNRSILYAAIVRYMNLPYKTRVLAQSKIALSYPSLRSILTPSMFTFINKHPLYVRVKLNPVQLPPASQPMNQEQQKTYMHNQRRQLYENILRAYDVLMKNKYDQPNAISSYEGDKVHNLMKNGESFQMLLNAVNIMDLYLNDYRTDLTKLYEEHFISNKQFFEALWRPYFHEIWTERIMEKYKRTFDWNTNIMGSWNRFRTKVWGYGFFGNPKSGLGLMLYSLSDKIWKMFTSKPGDKPVEQAQPDTSMPPVDEMGSSPV